MACKHGHFEIMEILTKIENIDLNLADSYSVTPLHYTTEFGFEVRNKKKINQSFFFKSYSTKSTKFFKSLIKKFIHENVSESVKTF